MSTALADVAGWIGAVLLLLAYAGNATGRLDTRGRIYQLGNAAGSAGLLAVGAAHGAWPSVALNAAWLAVAARSALPRRRSASGPPGAVVAAD